MWRLTKEFFEARNLVRKNFSKLEIWASSFYFLSKFFLPVLFLFLCAVFLSSRLLPERGQGGAGGAGDVTSWTWVGFDNALEKLAWLSLVTYAHHPCLIIITIAPLFTCLLFNRKRSVGWRDRDSLVIFWSLWLPPGRGQGGTGGTGDVVVCPAHLRVGRLTVVVINRDNSNSR